MPAPRKPKAQRKKLKGSFIESEGVLGYVQPIRTFVFMFDDATTVEVAAARDDSDLRSDLLAHLGKNAIVGVASLDRGDSDDE